MERHPLSAEDLFSLGFEAEIGDVVDAAAAGRNVALVAPPLTGHTAVLNVVESMADDVTRQAATEDINDTAASIRLYEDCHRLYLRRIGGFAELDAFLGDMAESSAAHVTTWNAYAWNYLEQSKAVVESFDSIVTLEGTDDDVIVSWLADLADEDLMYVDDSEEIPASFDPGKIRSPATLREQLHLLLFVDEEDVDPEEAVFDAITRLAGSNPGVAKTIWKTIEAEAATEGEVRTSMVAEREVTVPDFDYDDSYALLTVLANGSITKSDLETVVDGELDRTLRRFENHGLIELTGGHVSPTPTALKPLVEHLTNRRLLW